MSFDTSDREPVFPVYFEADDTVNGGDTDPGADLPADEDIAAEAMTAPDDWSGEQATNKPPTAGGDGIDRDPPTDTPVEASDHESEPERGEALGRLFDYVNVSGDEIHNEILDRVTNIDEPAVQDSIEHLTGKGMSLDDAVEHIAFAKGADDSLTRITVEDELRTAHLQYGEDLEKAGVRFDEDLEGIILEVTDPDAYARALDNMPEPADEEARARFDHQSVKVTSDAMISAAHGLTSENPGEEPLKLAQELPQQGDKLASALGRLAAPVAIVEAAEIMATAHRDGMDKEWAEGYLKWIIGNSDIPMGTDRYVNQSEWDTATEYLDRLARDAPNARFTRDAHLIVLRDMYAALHHLPELPDGGRGLTYEGVKANAQAYVDQMRRMIGEAALPVIEGHVEQIAQAIQELERRTR